MTIGPIDPSLFSQMVGPGLTNIYRAQYAQAMQGGQAEVMKKDETVYPEMTVREIQDQLTEDFLMAVKTRPQDFELDVHTLKDKKTGIQWWIANGRLSFGLWRTVEGNSELKLRFFQKIRCWRAFKKWMHYDRNVKVQAEWSRLTPKVMRLYKINRGIE